METNREGNEGISNENGNDSNVTMSPAASNSSVKSTRDINDVVEHPPTNDEQGGDEDDESSSCSEEGDTSEDEDSVDDPHLSEYERLRLRNIRRNEARLAQLGLLVPSTNNNNNSQCESQQSAFTATLFSSQQSAGRGRPKGKPYKKRDRSLEPTRQLPKRRAKIQKKFDPSSEKKEKPKPKRQHTKCRSDAVPSSSSVNAHQDYSSDDDSMPPTPIQLSKIIKPQSHQKDFHEDKKFYLKKRRKRRGRPKREEYVYVCDEHCAYCGGGWGEIVDVDSKGKKIREEVLLKDNDVEKVVPIDIGLLDDDTSKLVRCKDCREAFHPGCMRMHGAEELNGEDKEMAAGQGQSSTELNGDGMVASEEGQSGIELIGDEMVATGEAHSFEAVAAVAFVAAGVKDKTSVEQTCNKVESSSTLQSATFRIIRGSETCSKAESSSGHSEQANSDEMKSSSSEIATASMSLGKESEATSFDGCKKESAAVATENEAKHEDSAESNVIESSCEAGSSRLNAVSSSVGGVIEEAKSSENVAAAMELDQDLAAPNCTHIENQRLEGKPTRVQNNDEDAQQVSLPSPPLRIPKRCCKCEALRELGIGQKSTYEAGDQDDESNRDIAPPAKTRHFKLEASIDGKTVLCYIGPPPAMEAVVRGKRITCHIVFGGCDGREPSSSNTVRGNGGKLKEEGEKKQQKRQIMRKPGKIEKVVLKATDKIEDTKLQLKSIVELQSFIDGPNLSAAVVRAGGMEMLSNAMENHPNVQFIQHESIKAMTEIMWYNQSLGMELVGEGCLQLTISAMDCHRTNAEIQQIGCELFRALSYDSECCDAMFEYDIVTTVMSSMKRNPKELDVLKEACGFIQNMIVVYFDTVDILLKSRRGEDSVVPVLIDAIQEHQGCISFVSLACDLLSNISRMQAGISKIVRSSGGSVLHKLIRSTEASEVVQSAMTTLYNVAYGSSSLIGELVKTDCVSSITAALRASARNPELFAAAFGLLGLLAGSNKDAKLTISNQTNLISVVLDAIRNHKMLELEVEAFNFLSSIEYHTADKQLTMNTAKSVLQSMEIFSEVEEIQFNGCKILLGVLAAQPESRALKSLLRTGSGREILMSVPSICKDAAQILLNNS